MRMRGKRQRKEERKKKRRGGIERAQFSLFSLSFTLWRARKLARESRIRNYFAEVRNARKIQTQKKNERKKKGKKKKKKEGTSSDRATRRYTSEGGRKGQGGTTYVARDE